MTVLVSFVGPVSCTFDAVCPLSLRLRGRERGAQGDTALVDLAAPLLDAMLTPLQDAELEAPLDLFDRSSHNTPRTYLLNIAGKRRAISASRLMIHRDLRDRMHAVIPPRSVRIRTKLFWKLVFLIMRMPYASALLLRRYDG